MKSKLIEKLQQYKDKQTLKKTFPEYYKNPGKIGWSDPKTKKKFSEYGLKIHQGTGKIVLLSERFY